MKASVIDVVLWLNYLNKKYIKLINLIKSYIYRLNNSFYTLLEKISCFNFNMYAVF
ncbi:hypothetical protein YYC_02356 [Plasmodium yoelii 17X]|uniref:Uncharacterized protein n=2 Tax=Plasmodium yoelii TaxID=5861 RepID=Q7RDL5_PLAYO|nr:hypothetical protein [Plasmodium yoelii yoelii]ETB60747.1 hypothetical protein YYC_02356 [Plasmodium yoelii 17X]